MMNYRIVDIQYYLPDKIVTNDYLVETCGIDKRFIEEKVGIFERRIVDIDEPTSIIATKAAEKLFSNCRVKRDDIDLLLLCTQNPDYKLPTTACLVQDLLGLPKSTIAFDVNLGCSGFVYSLPIAGNFISSGLAKHCLLLMADEYSRIISYKDKNTSPIFGDAASAILLEPCEAGYGVLDANFGTDGSGWDKLIVYNSGVVDNSEKSCNVFMDGLEIFKFAVKVIPSSISQILLKNNLQTSDIKHFVFHQANTYIIKELQKRLKLSDEQVVIDMKNYGNTIQSTIPIALKNLIDSGSLEKGDLLILSGYGVGLSWGNILYKYI